MTSDQVRVRVVTKKNQLALVEYIQNGVYWRNWVPLAIIIKEGVNLYVDNPQRGIPYGEQFSFHLIQMGVSEELAKRIDYELKGTGVWTWADVVHRTDLVIRAYMSAHRAFANPLIEKAADIIRTESIK